MIAWMALREEVELKMISYCTLKPKDFYKCGICKPVDRWIEVQLSIGGYLND